MTEEDKSLVVRPTGIRKFNPQAESSLIARGLEALQALENKKEANHYYNLGNTHHRQGKYEEAIEAYHKAIEISPDYHHLAYYNLGNAYDEQGKFEEAIAAYNKAIEIMSNDAESYINLGYA